MWRMVNYQDGSHRERCPLPPIEELARGPVWLVDVVSGRPYLRARRATLSAGSLRFDGDDSSSTVALADVLDYERVLVVDPRGSDQFGRTLWEGVPAGTELIVVWWDSQDRD